MTDSLFILMFMYIIQYPYFLRVHYLERLRPSAITPASRSFLVSILSISCRVPQSRSKIRYPLSTPSTRSSIAPSNSGDPWAIYGAKSTISAKLASVSTGFLANRAATLTDGSLLNVARRGFSSSQVAFACD